MTGDYVSKLPGRAASVAVVVGKANAVAYVCDWRHRVAELFSGSRAGARVALRGNRGDRLTATVAGKSASGTISLRGSPALRFTAAAAKSPAGLYRAQGRVRGKAVRVGWVVLADGSQRGATTIGSSVGPAPTLSTSTSTATLAGTKLSVVRISSGSISQTGQIGTQGGFGG